MKSFVSLGAYRRQNRPTFEPSAFLCYTQEKLVGD